MKNVFPEGGQDPTPEATDALTEGLGIDHPIEQRGNQRRPRRKQSGAVVGATQGEK